MEGLGAQLRQHLNDGNLLALFSQSQSSLAANLAAADEHNALTDLVDVLVALLCDHDVGAVGAGNRRNERICAHSSQNPICLLCLDQLGGRLGVQNHLNAQLLHQVDLIVHELCKVILEGNLLGEYQLPAQTVGLLKDGNIMAALCSNDCSLHAGGAAADDNDLLGGSGLGDQILQLVLAANGGVDRTCKGLGGGLGILQAVEALDAGDDLVFLTVTCLLGHLGIGNGTTGHRHEVSAASSQGLLNELGILECTQSQHRLRNAQLLNLPGKAGILSGLVEDGGMHDGLGAGDGHIAGRDMCDINAVAGHAQELSNVLRLQLLVGIGIANLVSQLAAGDTVLDEDLVANSLADGVQDHHGEPAAVLEGAAELVGAMVEQRTHKTVNDQTVTTVDQDGVKADCNGLLSNVGVILGDCLHGLTGQHGALGAVGAGCAVYGIEEVFALALLAAGPAGIEECQQLDGNLGTIVVDLIHTLLPVTMIGGLTEIQVVPAGTEGRQRVHVMTGNGHGSGAAARLFHIVCTVSIGGIGLVGLQQMRRCRRLENAVFIHHVADLHGGEQRGVLRVCHGCILLVSFIQTHLFYSIMLSNATILAGHFCISCNNFCRKEQMNRFYRKSTPICALNSAKSPNAGALRL